MLPVEVDHLEDILAGWPANQTQPSQQQQQQQASQPSGTGSHDGHHGSGAHGKNAQVTISKGKAVDEGEWNTLPLWPPEEEGAAGADAAAGAGAGAGTGAGAGAGEKVIPGGYSGGSASKAAWPDLPFPYDWPHIKEPDGKRVMPNEFYTKLFVNVTRAQLAALVDGLPGAMGRRRAQGSLREAGLTLRKAGVEGQPPPQQPLPILYLDR